MWATCAGVSDVSLLIHGDQRGHHGVPKSVKIAGGWNDPLMNAARGDSQANLELIAQLGAMGVAGVTSPKLKRWRQAGASPRVVYLGVSGS